MTIYDITIEKLQQLPEPLIHEVSDFVDFLLMKHDSTRWQLWTHFAENLELTEVDFSNYLHNLEDYESRLASGEIQFRAMTQRGS
jgi:hypothetical protein